MRGADLMTPDPVCCSTDTLAQGGVVTDQETVCRSVAEGKDPHSRSPT